jgi:hypothetical protein
MKIGLKTILPSPSFDNHSFVEKETEKFFEFGLTISSSTNGLIGCTQTSEQCSVAQFGVGFGCFLQGFAMLLSTEFLIRKGGGVGNCKFGV